MAREPHVGHGFAVKRGAAELAMVGPAITGVAHDFAVEGGRGEFQVGLPDRVGALTAPAVARRIVDHGGAIRVEFDVAHARETAAVGLDER